jgi:hypothetical protein
MPVAGDPHGLNAVLGALPISAQKVAYGLDPRQDESAGDRVANIMHGIGGALLNLMPGYAQAHAHQSQASARQQAEVNMMLVRGAMEQASKGNTEFFENLPKDVEKAARTTLGPVADVAFGYFRHVAGAVSEHKASFGRLAADMRAKGSSPQEIVDAAAQLGIPVPEQFASEAARYTYGPEIAARSARATIDPAIEKQAALTPGAVSRAGQVTETQETTREPYRIATEGRSEQRALGREARGEERTMSREERAAARESKKADEAEARKSLGDAAIKWRNDKGEQPPATLTRVEAVEQGYRPVDPKENSWFRRFVGLPETKVGPGTHAAPKAPSPAQAVIDKWSGGGAAPPAAPAPQ